MMKSKKIMKRLFGILISIVMMMGMMATTAFAAGTATITINKPDNFKVDWKDMTVNAYKVLTVKNPGASKDQWIYEADSNFKGFFNIDTIEDAFTGSTVYLTYKDNHLQASNTEPENEKYITLTGDKAKELDATYGEADLISRLTGDSDGEGTSQNALLYTWLEKYIESATPTINSTKTVIAAESADSMVLDGLDEGYYALIFSKVPSGLSVKQGILISTNGEGANLQLKAEEIPFTKQVADSSNPNDPDLQWDDEASAAIGDTLSYDITAYVPKLTDYSNLTKYWISDTLSNQRLNEDSISITIDGKPADYNSVDKTYTLDGVKIADLTNVTEYVNKEAKFTLEFVTSALEKYEGKQIVVKYTAEVTTDAAKINGNTATLDYTNNGDSGQLTDDTKVYTYGIKVLKKFSDGSDNYSDVTFELKDANGTKLSLTGTDGVYKLVDSETDSSVQTLNLATDGSLTITGLDDDVNYILVETNTADNFNTVGDININLEAQKDNGKLLDETTAIDINGTPATISFVNNGIENDSAIAIAQFEVLNQKGFALPQTGGAGTWMLTIGGIILIAAAAGLFVASRRKSFSK